MGADVQLNRRGSGVVARACLGVVLTITSTACSSGTLVAGPPPSPSVPSPTALSSAQSFSGVGAKVEPAKVTDKPVVSQKRALALLRTGGLSRSLIGSSAPTKLQLVQYTNLFGTTDRTGHEVPSVPRQLAWLAIYENIPAGPGSGPANATLPPRNWTCTYYIALSASTGATIDGFDICT